MPDESNKNVYDEQKVTPISTATSATLTPPDTNGQAKVETDADGYMGRDLAIKATKKPPKTKTLIFPDYTEWAGAKWVIKELRGGEHSRIQSSLIKGKAADQRVDTTEQDAKLIIAASINRDGSPMWNLKNDLATVMNFPASVTEFLVEEIRNLYQKPKDAEEGSEGNSGSTASSGSFAR
jgi:hypothetical protein